jgi:hypothetical protein
MRGLLSDLEQYVLGNTEVHHVNFYGKRIDIKNLDFDKLQNEVVKENKIVFLTEHIQVLDSLVKFMDADGIGFNMVTDDSEFITSDNPVVIRNYKTGQFHNLFDPDNVIYLPIDPKSMLTITPKSFGKLENKVLRVLSTQDFTISINHDVEGNSEKWIIGSEDSIKNHLDDQAERNAWTPANLQWVEDSRKKAELMSELDEMLQKNGEVINEEVATKMKELAQNDLLKDDPQMKKALASLKGLGY